MEKLVFSANFLSQYKLSLAKLEGRIGSFILEATDTKNLLNSDEISEGLSVVLSLIFNEGILVPILRLLAPSSLKSFHTLAGLFTFSFIISEYCLNHFTHFISPDFVLFLIV